MGICHLVKSVFVKSAYCHPKNCQRRRSVSLAANDRVLLQVGYFIMSSPEQLPIENMKAEGMFQSIRKSSDGAAADQR